ncbi:hypothetical protein L493_3039 [Bordetella bronchiseptica 99-R-0433]|nr:hypothetical protein L493_3039 [Bordetella bronchiseptica 99-R-0433]
MQDMSRVGTQRSAWRAAAIRIGNGHIATCSERKPDVPGGIKPPVIAAAPDDGIYGRSGVAVTKVYEDEQFGIVNFGKARPERHGPTPRGDGKYRQGAAQNTQIVT